MNKLPAFILSVLFTILIANTLFFISFFQTPEVETSTILRVIDGDTLELQDSRIIRFANINAPEKDFYNSNLALNFLKQFENSTISFEILQTEKYGRLLARVYSGSEYLNLELVSLGFSSKFLVHESELKQFKHAELSAISQNKGIWLSSDLSSCFKSTIFPEEELIVLENICPSLNLKNWKLKDESRSVLVFPSIFLGKITIHTGKGKNNMTDIFWQSTSNILNNDRDSIYLFDTQGKLAHYSTYGY